MSSKYSQKWAVAAFFDDLEDGFTFDKSNNPLHITLAGVFVIDLSGEEISKLITDNVSSRPFSVEGGEVEQWGNLAVTRIKPSVDLDKLYIKVQQTLLDNGASFNEPQYLFERFKTHATHQKSGALQANEKVILRGFSLVDMFPDGDGEKRRIVKTCRFIND